tara:strand:+ start:33024 stop:34061 length:1038 start_codon:yes stop_codon:yes gene_type:complete
VLNNLFKLYHHNNGRRTPLEDFNTEAFAGILNFYPEILNSFACDFLNLPKDTYKVSTQEFYPLSQYPNCIVDMVLESEDCICFIENKVNSTEGVEQLDRYQKVLLPIAKKKEIVLRYITKWSDIKKNNYSNFKQYRWYEVADWLQQNFIDNVLVSDYYNFLKSQNMARKKEITTDGVIALKNFHEAYSTAKLHLESGHKIFQRSFPNAKIHERHMHSYKRIFEGGRVYYRIDNLFKDFKQYHSEILLAFHGGDVKYQLQLWVSIDHPLGKEIFESAKEMDCFDVVNKNEWGFMINKNIKLYNFIEDDDTDGNLKKWFSNTFEMIRKLIDNNPNLNWNPKVLLDSE